MGFVLSIDINKRYKIRLKFSLNANFQYLMMATNWQRIKSWIQPYCKVRKKSIYDEILQKQDTAILRKMPDANSQGLSDKKIAAYEEEFKVNLPEDFKEFHRKFNQDIYWRIGCWIILPLIEAIHYTESMSEIMVYDEVYDECEYYWNPQWLVFAEHIKKEDVMCLNLDSEADLESEKSIFYKLNEVFKFEYEDEYGYVCPMKMGFGRWLEKWAIKLERQKYHY